MPPFTIGIFGREGYCFDQAAPGLAVVGNEATEDLRNQARSLYTA